MKTKKKKTTVATYLTACHSSLGYPPCVKGAPRLKDLVAMGNHPNGQFIPGWVDRRLMGMMFTVVI